MFNILRSTAPHQPSVALQQALTQQGQWFGPPVNSLRVLTMPGTYAGRSVRFFRVFDPHGAAQSAVSVRTFKDLDAHPELVVGDGHVEHDGAVSVAERPTRTPGPTVTRARADRADHPDDEQLVFWNAEGSSSSAAHLSEAAASWLQARPTEAGEPVAELPRLRRV